jgi:hypothetical protein
MWRIYGVPEIGGAFTLENRKLLNKLGSFQKDEEVQGSDFPSMDVTQPG